MERSPSLRDASVQDIHLELIRRSTHNAFDGERVYQSLLKHRDLWKAALLDRPGLPNFQKPGQLPRIGLIKLRDLPHNIWNADTLFVLTVSLAAARELATITKAEGWGGELQLHEDRDETDAALGTAGSDYGLLSVWWD
jgi:hypothetical protein